MSGKVLRRQNPMKAEQSLRVWRVCSVWGTSDQPRILCMLRICCSTEGPQRQEIDKVFQERRRLRMSPSHEERRWEERREMKQGRLSCHSCGWDLEGGSPEVTPWGSLALFCPHCFPLLLPCGPPENPHQPSCIDHNYLDTENWSVARHIYNTLPQIRFIYCYGFDMFGHLAPSSQCHSGELWSP
jgi:hypothetical protein